MKNKNGRRLSLALIALVLAIAVALPLTSAENTGQIDAKSIVNTTTDASLIETPFTSVIGEVQKSVVGVNNYQNYTYSAGHSFSPRRERKTTEQLAATGSGVAIYDEYVITNYHVVENASRLSVSVIGSDEEIEAKVAGYDEVIDIAILYVPSLDIPYVPLGDSNQLQVGEWAIAIGNPLAEELRGTVTVGIISALDREIESTTTTDKYGLKTNVTNRMIQTDAAINSGNSGGGLFNVLGQLMGIPTMKYSGNRYSGATVEGIGLAVPINSAKPLIEEVLTKGLTGDNESAVVKGDGQDSSVNDTPRLGVTVTTVNRTNNEAVYAGLLPNGVMILEVEEGSPAEKAGIQVNDVIVEADGIIIANQTELSAMIGDKNMGDEMQIKLYRAKGLAEANTLDDIKGGEYIDVAAVFEPF
ncbi:MAG: trypsin-like peptidase domain-containing protein [Clostridia bacterium]|nr:trypsin-like peptidase domain-containing protein [Clostridia bacterium]